MMKNFIQMPPLLKVMTASTLAVLYFLVYSLIPGSSLTVFEKTIPSAQWWSSGAGWITCVVAFALSSASALMLRKHSPGRAVYVLGWVAATLSTLFVAERFGVSPASSMPVAVGNLMITVFVAGYLYFGKPVQAYFSG